MDNDLTDIDKLKFKPFRFITNYNKDIINIYKCMGFNKSDNNLNKTDNNLDKINYELYNNYIKQEKIDKITSFIYNNIKKISILKYIEEFESDTESEKEEDYASDIEY